MRKQIFLIASLFGCSFLFTLGVAQAIEQHMVTPDRVNADDISFDPNEPVTGYFHAGRSYECRLSQTRLSSTTDDYLYFSTSIAGPSTGITGVGVGNIYPSEAVTSSADASRQQLHRISFIANETGVHTLGVEFDNNRTSNASVECFETTLVGSFNSFLASTPIIELRNGGDVAVAVTVTAVNLDGSQIEQQTKFVPASSREDAILLNIPAMTYGKVLVTYLGPQGTVGGFVSEYNYEGSTPVLMRERVMRNPKVVP